MNDDKLREQIKFEISKNKNITVDELAQIFGISKARVLNLMTDL